MDEETFAATCATQMFMGRLLVQAATQTRDPAEYVSAERRALTEYVKTLSLKTDEPEAVDRIRSAMLRYLEAAFSFAALAVDPDAPPISQTAVLQRSKPEDLA